MLWNPGIAERAGEFQIAQAAACPFGLEVRSIEARDPVVIESALERAVTERMDSLYLLDTVVLMSNPARVRAFTLLHRLPRMPNNRSFVVAGGLTIPPSVLEQATEVIK